MAATGTRNGESVALRIGDIGGADRPVLHIQRGTKSGRAREVPLATHTSKRLRAYLVEREARGLSIGAETRCSCAMTAGTSRPMRFTTW